MTARARRRSILQAARLAFTDTGDINGTSIKSIAERAGCSEGVIYRYFESKDQLFYEAVVEPLHDAIADLVAAAEAFDSEGPLTPERQTSGLSRLYQQLVGTFREVLPLLGLVLFGDPQVARQFYREQLSVPMDHLAQAWHDVEVRQGDSSRSHEVTARVVMGTALMLALEARYNQSFDVERAIDEVAAGSFRAR